MQSIKENPVMFEVDGKAVLTGLVKGQELANYAILTVRDPLGFETDAADVIGSYMDEVRTISRNPMYTILLGKYEGVDILVCSSGSAGPEREIALLDLIQYANVNTFLHLGTSGTHREDIQVGDIIISTGAVRDEGLSREYIKETFPALAHHEVVISLIEAAQKSQLRYHVGLTRSNDSVYVGQGRPVCGYMEDSQKNVVNYWLKAGVLNAERETAATLVLSSLFNCRSGSINIACNNTTQQQVKPGAGIPGMIQVALRGIKLLSEKDKLKEKAGEAYWTPALGK